MADAASYRKAVPTARAGDAELLVRFEQIQETPQASSSTLRLTELATEICDAQDASTAVQLFALGARRPDSSYVYAGVGGVAWAVQGADVEFFLRPNEELLFLSRVSPQNDNARTLDVERVRALRWNGECVVLPTSALAKAAPETASNAEIPWRYLSDDVQRSLLKNPSIAEARKLQRRQCRAGYGMNTTEECAAASAQLSTVVASEVREDTNLIANRSSSKAMPRQGYAALRGGVKP